MSYLYILKHLNQPSFKIGKANCIWTRLKGIGGAASFDIENSHCIQFTTVDAAYRAERLLHRLFDCFLYGIDELNRYDGDTEHFKIECWDRVIAFCQANLDLIGGALSEVPAAPTITTQVTPKTTKKQKKDLSLNDFYWRWGSLVSQIEDLENIWRYFKNSPVGIYEKSHGTYFLISKGLGEMFCFGDGIGSILLKSCHLRGHHFGTNLLWCSETPEYCIGHLIRSPDEFLDKVDMAVEYLDETDPFYQLEIERLMMVGHYCPVDFKGGSIG